MDFEKRLSNIMNNFKMTKTAAKEEGKNPQDETDRLVAAPAASDSKTDSIVEEIEETLAGLGLSDEGGKTEEAKEEVAEASTSEEIEADKPLEEEEESEEKEEPEEEEESEEEEEAVKKTAALVAQGIAQADLALAERFTALKG